MVLQQNIWNDENLIKILKNNGVVVMPTDTLYGILGKAENEEVVNRIYELRKRAPSKPCIILIASFEDLDKFSVSISEKQKNTLADFTEPVSFILDCVGDHFSYLHRGMKTLAFRIPKEEGLRNLLKETGPLIAPSANTEAMPPSENTTEAKKYFGEKVDLYVDAGEIKGKASKIIRLYGDGSIQILRD